MSDKNIPLEVHDLTVTYAQKPVLWDVDFKLSPGKLTAIVGPNGAGKSTLIKAILDLVPRASGQVKIFGQPLSAQRKRIAYVPQRESVDWDFPITVLDVVMMGRYGHLGLFRRPGKHEKKLAREALEKVGMHPFEKRQISELSGGQQQRVFLARALVQDAEIYLMDEPFAGVDVSTEEAILSLLKELSAQGKSVVVVHHDLQTVQDYFDEVLLLNLRQVAFGPMESTFTKEQLQKTYGGRLNIFADVLDLTQKSGIVRE